MIGNTTQVKSRQRRNFIILAIIVGVGVVALLYVLSDHTPKEKATKSDKTNFVNPLEHIDAESIIYEKTQNELRETKKQTTQLQEKFDLLNSSKKMQDESVQKNNAELMSRIATLEKQLAGFQSMLNNPNAQAQLQGNNGLQGDFITSDGMPSGKMGMAGHEIREDVLSLTTRTDSVEQKPSKNPDTFVPSGSFVSAVMLSGADASAAVNSQSNPEPMVFRIIENGNLPNHTKSHLKGCRVTAAVIGDISSERGKIRLERLSCTFPNGETVEQDVEGTIEGPDGKNGVRGRPLWRDGAITQRVFTAGFLSGVANGVSSSYITNSVSAEGSVQTLNSARILQNGVASGSTKAMDKLSDYYIQRAEQYHPVIQLSAGTVVDIVFLKGFFLDGKKHENVNDQAVGSYGSNETSNLSTFTSASSDSQTLPLTDENVRRIQERSKELGLRVTTKPNVS